uniref:Uncharacterized protein n=1 Tax=Salix viminalis TaxID=40686 RepID=A0A6N2K444_SALVM
MPKSVYKLSLSLSLSTARSLIRQK